MRLTRSRNDSVVSGLLAGIGHYLGIDPTIVRIVVVILFFAIPPLPIIPLYIIGMIIVPKEPKTRIKEENPFYRHRESRKDQPRGRRMDKAFRKTEPVNNESSRQANTVEEDDWSDF